MPLHCVEYKIGIKFMITVMVMFHRSVSRGVCSHDGRSEGGGGRLYSAPPGVQTGPGRPITARHQASVCVRVCWWCVCMFGARRVGGPEALRLPGCALASTHRRRSLEGRRSRGRTPPGGSHQRLVTAALLCFGWYRYLYWYLNRLCSVYVFM